ncbi:MAG: sensor histidine kinase [Planctomycetota bacterium]|jgi:signal transduction histidine kinase
MNPRTENEPSNPPAAGRLIGVRTKIVAPFVLLFLLCLLLVGSIAVSQATKSVENRMNPERLAELVSRAGFPLNKDSLGRIRDIINCEIISFNSDFKLLASTFPEENQKALTGFLKRAGKDLKPAVMTRHEALPGYYFVFREISAPAAGPLEPAGLILALPENVMNAEKNKTIRPIIIAAVVGTILIILIGLYIAHTITRPIRRFAKFADEVQAGDLDRRIILRSRDEIRDLAAAFNSMLERLRDSESQLVEREKMAAIGTIATGMAHEIRNPLSSIRMTVQLLLRKAEDDGLKSDMEMILREIERLSYTLSELLIFAKPPKPSKAPTDLKELIRETIAVLRPQLDHHDITVEEDFEHAPPEADVDQNHIRQVMMNLVINAIEAMPEGGTIGIALAEENRSVILRVHNTGKPIPAKIGGRIFDAFFSTKAGGSGLGLAVTKIIIDGHRGEISYTSGSRGTEFRIVLPRSARKKRRTVDGGGKKTASM